MYKCACVQGPAWVKDDEKRAQMTPMAYYRKRIAKERGVEPHEVIAIITITLTITLTPTLSLSHTLSPTLTLQVSEAEVRAYDTVANRIRWHSHS